MTYFWAWLFGVSCFAFGFAVCAILSIGKECDEWTISQRRDYAAHDLERQ